MSDDKPTKFTRKDIDDFVQKLMTEEMEEKTCFFCGKSFYVNSSCLLLSECNYCYWSRWFEKERKAFFRSSF